MQWMDSESKSRAHSPVARSCGYWNGRILTFLAFVERLCFLAALVEDDAGTARTWRAIKAATRRSNSDLAFMAPSPS